MIDDASAEREERPWQNALHLSRMESSGANDTGFDGVLLAGRYRIEKRLGSGGMGEVYRAVNETLGRPVAIKVLRPELLKNVEIVERFMREARAAALVRHPNVVDVLDVLVHEGVPFIVQELLHGKDLSQYLEASGGKLPVDQALPLLLPVIEAVGVAHGKGVVHRDLKPENVFLHEVEGQVIPKVLDFGISKLTAPDAKKMTATGLTMGTPAYMSPEQIQGSGNVDPSSDVWSLGVVLFEVLSGRLPFEAETPGALFVKICTVEATRLDAVVSDVPPELVEIVGRCLRPSRAERYPDASALAKALRAVLVERGVESTKKLQAMGPKIIEALELRSAVVTRDAAEDPSAKAETLVARPAIASHKSKSSVAARASDEDSKATKVERPERRSIGVGTMIAGGVLALGVVGTALAFRQAQGADAHGTTGATRDGRDAASRANVIAAHPSEDVARASASEELPAQADASIVMNDDSAIPTPSLVAQETNGRPGRRTNVPRVRMVPAGQSVTRETNATTSATTPNAGSSSATEASSSRRNTHAATTYEP